MLSKCKNKYGCLGIAYNARHKKPWSACIFNKLIGRYKRREDAICARLIANNKHGLKGKHLIDSLVILRDIYATPSEPVVYKLQPNSNYHKLVDQHKIENECRLDPTKEYSTINAIIEGLGY